MYLEHVQKHFVVLLYITENYHSYWLKEKTLLGKKTDLAKKTIGPPGLAPKYTSFLGIYVHVIRKNDITHSARDPKAEVG